MNPLNAATVNEIVHKHALGQSIRSIARSMGHSQRAVTRALAGQNAGRQHGAPHPDLPPRRRRVRPSMVDAYREAIEGLLKRYPDITVIRLREELQALGYQGGYSTLRERVKTLRASRLTAPVQRFETGPGVQAQMDWAAYTIDFSTEGPRRVNLFSYLLGYSGARHGLHRQGD